MHKLLIKASAGKAFMTQGRKKEEEWGDLAIGLIKDIAIADVFGKKKYVTAKEMDKGITLEGEAIQLLNRLEFKSYQKNTIRLTANGFTGECDIDSKEESLIRDIKCPWSASSFSWFKDDLAAKARAAGYDVQLKIYMMLYERDHAKLDEVLLTTPIELLPPYEDEDYHDVDSIPEHKRITTIEFERDPLFEEMLLNRYAQAEKIYNNFITQLIDK